jgi:aminoglycoside phosphotransferase (APT) family kinase protein
MNGSGNRERANAPEDLSRLFLERAAVRVASRLGLWVTNPTVLSDSNNLVLWLRPAPVVAKVGVGHHRRLALELSIARHLTTLGAPISPPAADVPPEVHRDGNVEVTFWAYQPHIDGDPDPQAVAAALREVHEAMLSHPGRLPQYSEELESVAEVLGNDDRTRALRPEDRDLLCSALELLRSRLDTVELVPLHGSPHNGNMLIHDGDVRFIDFETACLGPVEWDLAHLSAEAAATYPGAVDIQRLETCRTLVSVKTSAWCWANFEHRSLRWHARHHLAVTRRFMGEESRG